MTTYQEAFTKCTGALRVAVDALEERIEEITLLRAQRDRLRLALTKEYNTPYVGDGAWSSQEIEERVHLKPGDMTDAS